MPETRNVGSRRYICKLWAPHSGITFPDFCYFDNLKAIKVNDTRILRGKSDKLESYSFEHASTNKAGREESL